MLFPFHLISSFVFVVSIHLELHYAIFFVAAFSVVDGLLHFTIISRATKKRMPHRHETTLYNDICYLNLFLPLPRSISTPFINSCCCRVVVEFLHLSFKCSSIHSPITYTHTHQPSHKNTFMKLSMKSIKFSLACMGRSKYGLIGATKGTRKYQ